MKNDLILILKRIKRDFKSRLIILLIALLLLLGTIVSINERTTEEALNNESSSSYVNRLYTLMKKGNFSEKQSEVSNLPHILSVLHEYGIASQSLSTDTWKTPNSDHTIETYTADNKSLPKIKYGTNFPDDDGFYMVCPTSLYPNSALNGNNIGFKITNKDKIDMQKYLGQTITFQFENANKMNVGNEQIEMKIVGLYEVNKHSLEDNTCYINENAKKYIFDTLNKDLPSYIEPSNPETAIIVIDDLKNLEEVEKQVTEKGYRLDPYIVIDTNFLQETKEINKTYSLILSAICILLLFIIFFKNTKNRLEYNQLLKYLGYKENKIFQINLIHNLSILVLAFFLSLALSILYRGLLNIIIYFRPFLFSKQEIIFSISYLLKIYCVIFISTILISLLNNIYIKYKLRKN